MSIRATKSVPEPGAGHGRRIFNRVLIADDHALVRGIGLARSIVLPRYGRVDDVPAAMRAGIKGYALKSQSVVATAAGIERRAQSTMPAGDPLTARERQVIKLIAEGYSTRECATILGVSVKTADSDRTRLMRELDIHGTAGLVRYPVRHHFAEV